MTSSMPSTVAAGSPLGGFASFSLEGRTALVTGAGRGIGRAIALSLSGLGAQVALLARTPDEITEVADGIRASGGVADGFPIDVTDFDETAAIVQEVAGRDDGLQIVINNVGGAPWVRELQDITVEDFEYALRLNLLATHNVMRAAAPSLFACPGRASVVNITSIAGATGLQSMSFYSAAKSGVVGLSRAAAREWGRFGVRVNCLAPGWVETKLSSGLRNAPSFFDATVEQIPMRRWGKPEEVAGVAAFLASDAAAYVNGTVVYVDGGLLA